MPPSSRCPIFAAARASQQQPHYALSEKVQPFSSDHFSEEKDAACYKNNRGHWSQTILREALCQLHNRGTPAWTDLQRTGGNCQRKQRSLLLATVQSFCRAGQLDQALDIVYRMDRFGMTPSDDVYTSILKECGKVKAVYQTKQIHVLLAQHKAQLIGNLGDHLVVALAKCGVLDDAYDVFVSLQHRSVFSWTALISGLADFGQGLEALNLHGYMQEDGVESDQHTFVCLLQACAAIPDLQETNKVHTEAQLKGFTSDIFVANTLLFTYGRCKSILDAENVFAGLAHHDSVSWNALLSAYVEQGNGEKTFLLYRQMQYEGVSLTPRTFVPILEACSAYVDKAEVEGVEEEPVIVMILELGKALHADALRKGFDVNVFVRSTLVRMYGKCGSILEAEVAFDDTRECNVVLWNVMLAAYVQQGEGEKALQFYRQMHEEGCIPSQETFVINLQACAASLGKDRALLDGQSFAFVLLNIGKALHIDAARMGFTSDAFVGSTLVSMYGSLGSVAEAEKVFDGFLEHNPVLWHTMLSAYVEHSESEKALLLYRQMQEEEVSSTQQTFLLVLQACTDLIEKERGKTLVGSADAFFEIGKAVHADARMQGFTSDVFVGNTVVNMYGKSGSIVEAENAFGNMLLHDAVSWRVMLSVYVEHGHGDKALQLYTQMQEEDVGCDEFINTCLLQACIDTASLETCLQAHFNLVCTGYDCNIFMPNTLIRAYGSCASMEDAIAVFDGMYEHDLVSWNACIAGYAQEGNIGASLQLFVEMEPMGMLPDRVTFLSLLTACCHASLVDKGVGFFESMIRDYCFPLHMKHYVVMIDILGRTGNFEKLEGMLLGLPMQAYLAVWLCWLGACNTHNNIELGRHAFDSAVNSKAEEATLYVLMSNIYAADVGLQGCQTENLQSWR